MWQMKDIWIEAMNEILDGISEGLINGTPSTSAKPVGVFNVKPPDMPRYGDDQIKKTFKKIYYRPSTNYSGTLEFGTVHNAHKGNWKEDIIVLNKDEYKIENGG